MKILYTFISLCALFLISCNTKNEERSLTKEELELIQKSRTEWEDIVGEWQVGMGDGVMCNVCPRISFQVDNRAKFHLADGQVQSLIWGVRDHKLVFENVNASDPYFGNGWYDIKLIKGDKSTELRLIRKEENVEFVLQRAENP